MGKSQIGDRIRKMTYHFCETQGQFGGKVGVTNQSISHLINGHADPSYTLIFNILSVFPVDAYWLILGEGDMLREDDCERSLREAKKEILYLKTEVELYKRLLDKE